MKICNQPSYVCAPDSAVRLGGGRGAVVDAVNAPPALVGYRPNPLPDGSCFILLSPASAGASLSSGSSWIQGALLGSSTLSSGQVLALQQLFPCTFGVVKVGPSGLALGQ